MWRAKKVKRAQMRARSRKRLTKAHHQPGSNRAAYRAVSETTLAEYRNHSEAANIGLDLSVHVLTQVYWPTTPARECKIPPVVKQALDSYERFYVAKHHNRTIALSPGLGQADVRAVFYGAQAMDTSSQLVSWRAGSSTAESATSLV